MNRGLLAAAALISALSVPLAANASSPACPGFEANGSSPEEVDRFYAMRAIDILHAGLSRDHQLLDRLVAPDADFIVWDADATSCCRARGTDAAIELAQRLKASRYQFWSNWSMVRVRSYLKCEWSVGVMFTTADRDSSVRMDYKFVDGRLVSAKGQRVRVVQGPIE